MHATLALKGARVIFAESFEEWKVWADGTHGAGGSRL